MGARLDLSIDTQSEGAVTVLRPKGFINAHTVKEFDGALQQLVARGCYRIVISGQELAYIASAGLGALMGVIEEVRSQGGDIRLAELNETVFNVFEILGFTHLYRIFDSVDAATSSFNS
jgi:anti-sigma B factor antagonist